MRRYRTALITGASGGIGHALARWLAERGVRVWAAARRIAPLEALAREAPGVTPLELDVRDAARVRHVLRDVDGECGGLDLVVANAAVGPDVPVDELVDTNVRGAAATLDALVERMVARGSGHLVGISSLAALRGAPGGAAYCASKAFLSTFLEGLRGDLRGSGVLVTAIHPGFVRTPGTAGNAFRMPFLLEADDAAARIGAAISRGVKEHSFPWPAAVAARIARALPDWLWDRLAR